ncbi:hypothetical protein VP01_14661g1, partial [Puccinia sorghi]
ASPSNRFTMLLQQAIPKSSPCKASKESQAQWMTLNTKSNFCRTSVAFWYTSEHIVSIFFVYWESLLKIPGLFLTFQPASMTFALINKMLDPVGVDNWSKRVLKQRVFKKPGPSFI